MGIDSISVRPEKNIPRLVIKLVYIEEKIGGSLCVCACVGRRKVMRLRYSAPTRLPDEGVALTGPAINVNGIHSKCGNVAGTKVMMITVDR